MKKVIKILAPTLTFIVFAVTINWGYVGLLSKQLIQAATEVARGEGTTSQMLLEELRDFQARDIFNMQVIQKLPFVDLGDGTGDVLPLAQPGDDVLPSMVPGGAGDVFSVDEQDDGDGSLSNGNRISDDAYVVRGGTNTVDRFIEGSGVTVDSDGKLHGVSVNCKDGLEIKDLSKGIKNGKIGITTVGEIRKLGGDVIPNPTKDNPNHALLSGITPEQASELFTPVIDNPEKKKN